MARHQVTIFGWRISWERTEPFDSAVYVNISTKIAIELIRDAPEAAARIAAQHAQRAVYKVARVLKKSDGSWVLQ